MKKRTKIIIVSLITIALIVGMSIYIYSTTKDDSSQLEQNDIVENSVSEDVNNSENDTKNQIEENITEENVIEENTVNENTVIENNSTSPEQQIVGKEEEETEKEIKDNQANASEKLKITEKKAIELVKKSWGEDDSIYCVVANKDDNNYYISVNDSSTTSVLAWYTVDINTGNVSEN